MYDKNRSEFPRNSHFHAHSSILNLLGLIILGSIFTRNVVTSGRIVQRDRNFLEALHQFIYLSMCTRNDYKRPSN